MPIVVDARPKADFEKWLKAAAAEQREASAAAPAAPEAAPAAAPAATPAAPTGVTG
jgi:cytochrome c oxidase subunit 2